MQVNARIQCHWIVLSYFIAMESMQQSLVYFLLVRGTGTHKFIIWPKSFNQWPLKTKLVQLGLLRHLHYPHPSSLCLQECTTKGFPTFSVSLKINYVTSNIYFNIWCTMCFSQVKRSIKKMQLEKKLASFVLLLLRFWGRSFPCSVSSTLVLINFVL